MPSPRQTNSIMWIVLVMVVAMSGASGINMSMRLGQMDHVGAKQAGYVGVGMSAIVCSLIGIVVWAQINAFGRIFTNDPSFLSMFEEARTPFIITLVLMNMSIALEKIPYSMGRTTEVFWMGLIASWGGTFYLFIVLSTVTYRHSICVFLTKLVAPSSCAFSDEKTKQNKTYPNHAAQVPAVFAFTKYWRNDLIGLYTGMAVGYAVLVLLYSIIAFSRYVFFFFF